MHPIRSWAFSALILAVAVLFYVFFDWPSPPLQEMAGDIPGSLFDIAVKDMDGNDVSLGSYSGKVLLIVNVASKCGFTNSNYKEMNVLYDKYKDKGFEVLAFPCNQFASQEPGTIEEIKETACTVFKAEFPIFDKIEVNGNNAAPLYKFLKSKKGGFLGSRIKWNFTKFLVDKDGNVVDRYSPTTSPLKIEVLLSASRHLLFNFVSATSLPSPKLLFMQKDIQKLLATS
ncbi:glutathione peroxidase [Musa troglodytarum]|uniref:Glutathione peroxidase n=1 Tax=Musa troglodytarum TaxID=320322 RepID=A0A9E7H3W3_9LILI|nr:glutathione peroxidase [Musa troglodytarum]